jgi:hypothetical protein
VRSWEGDLGEGGGNGVDLGEGEGEDLGEGEGEGGGEGEGDGKSRSSSSGTNEFWKSRETNSLRAWLEIAGMVGGYLII